jgi:hypothetical protein
MVPTAATLARKSAVVSFLPPQHRYNAACTAALAATSPLLPAEAGRRVGAESPLDDTARAKLRNQARVWLEAELASWSELLETAKGEQRASITKTLQWWQQDTDLAGIRESEAAAAART